MTNNTAIRTATIRRGTDSVWQLHLCHEGLPIITLPYNTHAEALDAALRWTHLT